MALPWKEAARKFHRAYRLSVDPKLMSMHLDEGGLHMGISANGVGMILAHSFWELLSEHPEAKNYIEMRFERHGEIMTVTVQRQYGKTPGQVNTEAVSENQKLQVRVAELEAALDAVCPYVDCKCDHK